MPDLQLDDLTDRIRPQVRQCPADTIRLALVDIMRDFYFHTRAYSYEDTDTVQALVSEYELSLPSTDVEQISIEQMTVDKCPSNPKTPQWIAENVAADWRTRSADDFRYFTQLKPGTFIFPCVPTKMGAIGGIYYRISLRPTLDADTIDSDESARWLDTWSAGTLWKLKSMGGTPPPAWYDPKGATEKFAEYRYMRGQARIEASKGFTNASQTFGNRRSRFA